MGIKFRCHACDKKLHVKTFLAGKRGVCPRCGGKVRIPHESQDTSRTHPDGHTPRQHATDAQQVAASELEKTETGGRTVSEAAATDAPSISVTRDAQRTPSDPIAQAPDAVWYVRPPSGGEYGPANGTIMRRWLEEGRVSDDSMVWREGWQDWKEAGSVFPQFSADETIADQSPAPSPVAATMDHPLPIATDTPTARRRMPTGGRKNGRRNVTIITVMSILSVILLIVLVIVLQGHG